MRLKRDGPRERAGANLKNKTMPDTYQPLPPHLQKIADHLLLCGFVRQSKHVFRFGPVEIVLSPEEWHRVGVWDKETGKELYLFADPNVSVFTSQEETTI